MPRDIPSEITFTLNGVDLRVQFHHTPAEPASGVGEQYELCAIYLRAELHPEHWIEVSGLVDALDPLHESLTEELVKALNRRIE